MTSFATARFSLHVFTAALFGLSATVHAQSAAPAKDGADYPNRPLRLIVPFPPGGAADSIARLAGNRLAEKLGQPVSIDNRPGGGTVIAAQAAASAAPDGYTLSLATTGQLAINPGLHARLPYDPVKSFQPIANLASVAYVISVNPQSNLQTLQELITQARAKPGSLAFSSCGNATVCHLTGELLKSNAGIDLLHVPFSGSVPAITALMGGQVQLAADTVTVQAPHIRAGKLRGLVITDAKRSPAIPNVPTAQEAGLPEFIANSWFGIVVPAGTPAAVTQRLTREFASAAAVPAWREQFSALGLEPLNASSDEFAQQIRGDLAKWSRVVKVAAVKAD